MRKEIKLRQSIPQNPLCYLSHSTKIPRRLIKDELNIHKEHKQEVSSIKFLFCFHKKKIFWKQLDCREREEEGHNAYVYKTKKQFMLGTLNEQTIELKLLIKFSLESKKMCQ